MSPTSINHFVQTVKQAGLLTPSQTAELDQILGSQFEEPKALAGELLRRAWLTSFQVNALLQGRGSQLTLGSYVLVERLGEGGTGQVFKARHQRMNRLVALKVIRQELLTNAEVVQRFYREIQTISRLSHPNIVHPFDAGPLGSVHTLVMEFINGVDLARLVQQSGPLSVGQACDYIRQAALGLQHAHERGLVHRDIKPSNLLVARGTEPPLIKVLDLGLARLQRTGDGELTAKLTPVGSVTMGTPDYLAPEQAIDFHRADIRADIYGLGCTLFFLLTGQPPFPGGSLAHKLLRHQQAKPPSLESHRADLPPALHTVLDRMLAKEPDDRYRAPAEVAEVLGGISSGPSGTAHAIARTALAGPQADTPFALIQDTVKQPAPVIKHRRGKRRWLVAGAAAALLLMIGLVVPLVFLGGGSAPQQAQPKRTTTASKRTNPTQAPPSKVLFADDFASGQPSAAWAINPPKGYWSVSGGRLIASGPTIYGPGPKHQDASLLSLPAGVATFEVDIEAPVPRAAIALWTRGGKAGIMFGPAPNNILEWATWDIDKGNKWSGWNNAGAVDGSKVHTYKITLGTDGAVDLWVDGKVRASAIRVGTAAEWKDGIPELCLYTEGNEVGVVLGARFSKVRALAR